MHLPGRQSLARIPPGLEIAEARGRSPCPKVSEGESCTSLPRGLLITEEITSYIAKCFSLPSGKVGTRVVSEINGC